MILDHWDEEGLVYPPPHMTCMYPPPHMTCTYPPPHMTCMYPPPHMTCMYPSPHMTCMYPSPHMVCMYPPPQDMVHVTLRARPTTAGPSTTSASSSWTSPQPLSASRQCTSLLMLKVKDFFLMYIVLYAYIYVYVFM